jgi:hypothetical protein
MKKYKAIFDAYREIIIHAETREEANEEAVRRWPRGFDFADLQELEEKALEPFTKKQGEE